MSKPSQPTVRLVVRALLCTTLASVPLASCNCDPEVSATPTPQAVLRAGGNESPPLEILTVTLSPTSVSTATPVEIFLANRGPVELQVTDVVLTSDPDLCPQPSGAFSITDPATAPRSFAVSPSTERSIRLAFTPTLGQSACTMLEVRSNDPENPSLFALISGQGDAPALCTSTNSAVVDFGEVQVNSTTEQTLTLRSCGTQPITITQADLNGQFPDPFTAGAISVPHVMAVGDTLDVPLTFHPLAEGQWTVLGGNSGVITLTTDAAAAVPYRIDLIGSSQRPPSCDLQVVPLAVQFGDVGESRDSTQNVIVKNIGDENCTFDNAVITAGASSFSVALVDIAPGQVLAPLASGTLAVTFAPQTAAGAESGTLHVTSNDPVRPAVDVSLQGNSVAVQPCFLEATPTAVNFGNQPLRRTAERTVRMTNVGTEDCIVTDVVTTAGAPEFGAIEPPLGALADSLPPPFDTIFGSLLGSFVPSGESVDFIVTFRGDNATPADKIGNVRFTYKELGFGSSDQTIDVPETATVAPPCIRATPADVDFGNVAVGNNADQEVRLENCGGSDLFIRGIGLRSGSHPDFGFAADPVEPQTLAPGAATTVTVRAAPTAAGQTQAGIPMYGTLEALTDGAPGLVSLRANATSCTTGLQCAPATVAFGEVELGESMTKSIICQNPGTSDVTLAPSVAAPFFVDSAPPSIRAGSTGVIRVRYTPTDAGANTGTVTLGANNCSGAAITVATNGSGTDGDLPTCPTPRNFTPVATWEWDGDGAEPASRQTWSTPLVARLEDTTGDGVITREDMPRVVFLSFNPDDAPDFIQTGGSAGNQEAINDPVPGVLRAIGGNNGAQVWTNTAVRFNTPVTPAIMDLDGDGCVEIIGQKYVLLPGVEDIPGGPKIHGKFAHGNLLAIDCHGEVKWESEEWTRDPNAEIEDAGGVAVGDVDGDGFAEVAIGDTLYDHNGHMLWKGGKGIGTTGHGPASVLVDVDGQPGLELVAGATVYRNTGTILWDRSGDLGDGHPGVADLDGDGKNEVVLRNSKLYVLNGQTGATIAGGFAPPTRSTMGHDCQNIPSGGEQDEDECNIIPTNMAIMNVDGSPNLEIAVSAQELLIVYDRSLNEVYRAAIADGSGAAGPVGFDFEADGTQNVVFADEQHLMSWSKTGVEIYRADRRSVTMMEYASVADIDNDGHANMIVGSNEPQLETAQGLDAFENTGEKWAQARGIWNQHAYVEDLVSELGTPIFERTPHAIAGYRTTRAACIP